MGIGGFLASQAERDHYRYLKHHTAARVIRSCEGEMEREVRDVLGPIGVDDKTCSAVARCLRDVEVVETDDAGTVNGPSSRVPDEEEGKLRWSSDVGLTAFLLKFGLGLGTSSFSHYLTVLLTVLQRIFLLFVSMHLRSQSAWVISSAA